jgi:murein tripeptide amidase MpaA
MRPGPIGAILFTLAVLGVAPTARAQLPPAPPWSGASERLVVGADNPWVTPAELAHFEQTPSYAETRAWLERLDAASPLVRIETFGRSPQGRDLLAVFAGGNQGQLDPGKPTLLVQAGIHAGEIDGKDAGMMLLRDIAFGPRRALIERANLVFIPILNVDGHERTSAYNRPNQRGPANQGWRTSGQNLNLNRDYTKLDAPEMRALIAFIRRMDPDLYLDIHVTDGADYQYDVTYGYQGSGGAYAASPRIALWLDSRYRPQIDRALRRAGHIPGDLVFAVDDQAPNNGLAAFTFPPRFSHAYGDIAHIPTVLVENHSLKPYRQRVLGAYVLIQASLRLLASQASSLRAARSADRARRPATIPVGWRASETPRKAARDFLPMKNETYRSPASGRDEIRWTGRPDARRRVDVYPSVPTAEITRPRAYWIQPTQADAIDVLRLHGIVFEVLDTARTIEVEMLRLPEASQSAASESGRQRASAGRPVREVRAILFPVGSVRVSTDQPLGDLAAILLEPQSEDSLFAWGFMNAIYERIEYMEGYVIAPMAERMLHENRELREAFEARLATDPAFAADGDARLRWFYERSPYYDKALRLYPIGIER